MFYSLGAVTIHHSIVYTPAFVDIDAAAIGFPQLLVSVNTEQKPAVDLEGWVHLVVQVADIGLEQGRDRWFPGISLLPG